MKMPLFSCAERITPVSYTHLDVYKRQEQPNCDFGKHVIPYCHEKGDRLFAYEYNGYWKDVGTLTSYWEANMELIDIIPEFDLYEEFWKIYTNSANICLLYTSRFLPIWRLMLQKMQKVMQI